MNQEINIALGKLIREYRQERLRVTQDELARRIGISRPSLANVEAGRQQLSVVQLVEFSKAFGVSPATLMSDIFDEESSALEVPELSTATSQQREWAIKVLSGA